MANYKVMIDNDVAGVGLGGDAAEHVVSVADAFAKGVGGGGEPVEAVVDLVELERLDPELCEPASATNMDVHRLASLV